MPKKQSKERQPWEVDFIRCDLTKERREQLKKWDVKYEVTIDTIDTLVREGYKLSSSCPNPDGSFGAWLTSPKTRSDTRQKCLGAWGPSFLDALRAVAFKHTIILERDWEAVAGESGMPDGWA